jgi:acyl-CoA ligase (AMP-forming) (exosortase A-associated)
LIDADPFPKPLDHLCRLGTPNDPALITRDGTVSFFALEQLVGQFASALIAAGLRPGDRVASWLGKTRTACLLPLAAARAGLIHVPVNPQLRRGQVAHILADSGAALLVSGSGRLATLEPGDCPPSCRQLREEDLSRQAEALAPLPPSSADPDSLCAILYTSGSTGQPKGVMLSHANLWLGAISVASYLELAADDRTLCVLPFSFDYGQNQLLSAWAAGGCAVPLDYLTPRDVVRAVERYRITTLAGVPPLWFQLVEAQWTPAAIGSIRRLTNSGGALTPALVRALVALFPDARLFPMYGLTEAFRSTYLDPALVCDHPLSMGKAIPFAEVMIVRPDGSAAADGEAGELVHAGPLVAKGYWRDPERTAMRFRAAPSFSRCGGMAVWSGDTVRREADGLHYFVGRSDEMIKVSGNRISPTEIEAAAAASGVAPECVAIGVPDERLGQTIVLVARGDGSGEEKLMRHFRTSLPGFMVPARIDWRDELPRNPNGKLDRAALRRAVTS